MSLGAPQMRFLLVIQAPSEEQALRGAEVLSDQLRALQARQIIDILTTIKLNSEQNDRDHTR